MGSRVRIRLFHLHFVMDFLFPLLKNSKSGVDDPGHRLRITHTRRRQANLCFHFAGSGENLPDIAKSRGASMGMKQNSFLF